MQPQQPMGIAQPAPQVPPHIAQSPQFGAAKAIAMEGLPQLFKQLFDEQVTFEAMELLAGAERQEAMDNAPPPNSIKAQNEQRLNAILASLGPGIRQRSNQMAQEQLPQQGGLPTQPANNMAIPRAAQGGIVGFAQGGLQKKDRPIPAGQPSAASQDAMAGDVANYIRQYNDYKASLANAPTPAEKQQVEGRWRVTQKSFHPDTVAAAHQKMSAGSSMAGGGIVSFQPGGFIERAGQRVMDYFDSGYQGPNAPSAFEQFLLDQGIDPNNVSAEQLDVLRDVFRASAGLAGEGAEATGDFIQSRIEAADTPTPPSLSPEMNRRMVEGMMPGPNLEDPNIEDSERDRLMVAGMTGEGEQGFAGRAMDQVGEWGEDLWDYASENPLGALGYASLAIPGVGLAGLGVRGAAAGIRGLPAAWRFLRGTQNVAPAGSRIGRGGQALFTRPQTSGMGSGVRGPKGFNISAAEAQKLGIPLNRVISRNRAGTTIGAGLLGADALLGGDGETDEEIISDVVTTAPSSIEDTFASANEQAQSTQETLGAAQNILGAQREIAGDASQSGDGAGESGNVLERMVDQDMQDLRDTSPQSSLFDKKLEQIMNRAKSPARTIATFLQGYGEGKMEGAGKALRAAEAAYDQQEMELLRLQEANRISQEDFRLKRQQIQNERRQLDILEDRYITQGENEAARVAATREYYSVLASGNEGRIRIALQEALDTYRADTLRVNTDIAALEGMQLDQVRKMQTRNPEEYLNLRRQAEANYRRDLESGYYQGAGAGPSSTSQLQSEAAAIIGQ